MKITLLTTVAIGMLLSPFASALAAGAGMLPVRSGTHVCTISVSSRSPSGGAEQSDTKINFRNVDNSKFLLINQFLIYNGSGSIVYNSGSSGVPAGIAGGIPPYSGKSQSIRSLMGGDVAGPAIVVLKWRTAGSNAYDTALPPSVGRKIDVRSSTSGTTLAERSGKCRRLAN